MTKARWAFLVLKWYGLPVLLIGGGLGLMAWGLGGLLR